MSPERTKNGEPVTLAKVYEVIAPIENRLRRVEYAVVAILVMTASPKFGGPSAPEALSALIHLF